ncbi:MAG: hypothetical protein HOV80_04555 [Polyangiaceae bacterium]|nr:hypothetical protein [Polyangiaceae bacterium]
MRCSTAGMPYGLMRLPPPDMSLVLARCPEPPAPIEAAPDEPIALDENDFEEVWDFDVDVYAEDDELRATNELEPAADRDSGTYARELTAPPDPSSARYLVSAGPRPGEIVLRPLEPDEPPPFGVPVAMIEPSCALDAWSIGALLDR